jgi:hypothetical protein
VRDFQNYGAARLRGNRVHVSCNNARQANGCLNGVPPLLLIRDEEKKRQQKEARRMRIAECGSQLPRECH